LTIVLQILIMTSTQELVVLTNIVLATTILIGRIPPSPLMVHGDKLEKFNGLNFKMWQYKILYYLTILNLGKLLLEKHQNYYILNLVSLLW